MVPLPMGNQPMTQLGRAYSLGGRVTAEQMRKVDAAVQLAGVPRSTLVVQGTLAIAEQILRSAVDSDAAGPEHQLAEVA